MPTEEIDFVKKLIQKRFREKTKDKKNIKLPAILVVLADIFSANYKKDSSVECSGEKISCMNSSFDNCEDCITRERFFFIYNEYHRLIFSKSFDLPNDLQISNSKLTARERSKLQEIIDALINDSSHMLSVLDFQARSLINCYSKYKWEDRCVCPLDNYLDVLAVAFFFIPDIICCAIETQLEEKDINVRRTIRTCLELYIFADKIDKRHIKPDVALVNCSNFKHITPIEDVTAEKDFGLGDPRDAIDTLKDISSEGLRAICERIIKSQWKSIDLIRITGVKCYLYLKKYCATMGHYN